jgi:hypothetical protein
MKIEYETEGLMVTHQAARSLFKIGVIDAARMREFDEICLPSPKPAARKPARKAPGGGNRTASPPVPPRAERKTGKNYPYTGKNYPPVRVVLYVVAE